VSEKPAAASAEASTNEPEEFVLTPEIMAYENRRNDLIIAGAVLLFAFFLGTYKETYPDLMLHLATGRAIAQGGIPKTDPFSYGAPADKSWVNPNWLFDAASYQIYNGAGDITLTVLKALLGVVPILCLLFIRHSGPTLW
jgi:hypothetical protein